MLLPHVIEYNASQCKEALHKYAVAAKKAGLATQSLSDRLAVKRLIARIREMNRQMNCPMSLQAFGVDPKEATALIDIVVEHAKADGTFPGNPVTPSDEDLAKVYQAIIR